MQYRYIAIEGNIGAGKTTLAHLLAAHFDARLIPEEFADNNFLPKFYAEPERYAFPLELSFLADRYKQLKQLLAMQDMFRMVVSDYIFTKSKLFARINLKEEEYDLFQRLFDIIDLHLAPPDLLIYLHTPVPRLQENIRRRGRNYEQAIPDDYLERVQEVYSQYLKQELCRTVIIDTTGVDFLGNPAHFSELLAFLEEERSFKTYHLKIGQAI